MTFGRLPLHERLPVLGTTLRRNTTLIEVLTRAAAPDPPGWYFTAGCVCQTVWNVVTVRAAFHDLPSVVEIRNEARVHLWYEPQFGVPCPPYDSAEAATDSFAATTCCVGVRLEADQSCPPSRRPGGRR